MEKKFTIHDIAKKAGVSSATISRTLFHPNKVSVHTREKINKIIQETGYIPNAAARALASGQSNTIGWIVPTLNYSIFATATHFLQKELALLGYQLLIGSHEYDLNREYQLAMTMIQESVQAIIFVGSLHHPDLKPTLKKFQKPHIFAWSLDKHTNSIGFDNFLAGQLAARHLLERGHQRIGVISGFIAENDRARQRLLGMKSVLGHLDQSAIEYCEFSYNAAAQATIKLYNQQKYSAILCGNDTLATGAIFQLHNMGVNIPHQMAIIGIDNLELSAFITPGLTTINLPTDQLGIECARLIPKLIENPDLMTHKSLPITLITRQST